MTHGMTMTTSLIHMTNSRVRSGRLTNEIICRKSSVSHPGDFVRRRLGPNVTGVA